MGHPVIMARAENLPFRSNSCQGVLSKVVIPYTDERLAIEEIGRVLAPGGVAVLYFHGIGYSLRYLLKPDIWKGCLYGPEPSPTRSCTVSSETASLGSWATPCTSPNHVCSGTIARPA